MLKKSMECCRSQRRAGFGALVVLTAFLLSPAAFSAYLPSPSTYISVPKGYSLRPALAESGKQYYRGSEKHIFDSNPAPKRIIIPRGAECALGPGDGLAVSSPGNIMLFRTLKTIGASSCPLYTDLRIPEDVWNHLMEVISETEKMETRTAQALATSPPSLKCQSTPAD